MTLTTTPSLRTVIYPVRDLARATDLFRTLLGAEPVMAAPYYVQFVVDGVEIGLDPHGHGTAGSGPVGYWHVADIEAALADLRDAGAESAQGVRDVGGRRIATVTDADGTVLGLLQQD
jgi:predicted enzyme related to lactoylglutathione lyase